jgi:hypothetical protein
MLMRIGGELHDLPDDIGVAILADPSHGDNVSDWTAQEVNVLLHGTLGILNDVFGGDQAQSLEEYIQAIRAYFASAGTPSEEQIEQARRSIDLYKREIRAENVGMVEPDEMFQFQRPRDLEKVIDGARDATKLDKKSDDGE